LHADNIKQLTSHGRIEARGMRSNIFTERIPAFTPWIATNELPEVRHADSATKKRLIAFPFREQVTLDDDDSDWITRLSEHDLEAVLAWIVAGWKLYRERGIEQMPPAVAEATQELREALSPVDTFLADMTELAPGEGILGGELYEHFELWWEKEGHRRGEILTRSAFGRALTDRGYAAKHTNRGSLRMGLKMQESPSY
jgi:phage/plasmid-associated DNA primase